MHTRTFSYLILIGILCATFLHLSLLFQSDLVAIGSTFVSATIFVYPFTCIALDITAEVYGYKAAKQTLWATIIANIIFGVATAISTKLPIPSFWSTYDHHYDITMAPIFKTTFVGIGSIIIGQFFNIYAFSKLKMLTRGKYFALRSTVTTMIGDTLTVAIALAINFSTRISGGHVITIIVNELMVMYGFAIFLSIPANLLTNFLKKLEHTTADHQIENPFKEGFSSTR